MANAMQMSKDPHNQNTSVQDQLKSVLIPRSVLIMGIETSCDETAISIVRRAADGKTEILSNIIASQHEAHSPFGGVVPEIAAREHMDKISDLTQKSIDKAGITYVDLDAIAATAGPGLIGGVITGLMWAKGLAVSLDVPFVAVNHLEGHALSVRLEHDCAFPYLLLLVSGGHTQLLSVNGLGDYTRLGSTVDDAAGEAFDKTAKIMQLGFPGGPALEKIAKRGKADAVKLPHPFKNKPHADFSFSGLKTAVSRAYDSMKNKAGKVSVSDKADLAASFQHTVSTILCERTGRAMDMFKQKHDLSDDQVPHRFVVAGGVASNQAIRSGLQALCRANNFDLIAPKSIYCTDNGAMIALAGAERLLAGQVDGLDAKARPRWPLDGAQAAQNPASGSGRKGPKS